MSEDTEQQPLETNKHIARLLDKWASSLARVLESMSGEKPSVQWQLLSGRPEETDAAGNTQLLWWEQPFAGLPGAAIWVGASEATWDYAGSLTLKAAGIETIEPAEAKSTWLELMTQSLAMLTDSLSLLAGREIACEAGRERAPGPDMENWASVTLQLQGTALPAILAGFSPTLIGLISSPVPQSEPESSETLVEEDIGQAGSGTLAGLGNFVDAAPSAASETMDVLLEVDLPVSISFGRTKMAMRDVLKLTMGSIVELDRAVNDPVEVYVNHCLIARGEVVVVDGNYGIRIQQIASRPDRLRSIS
jgi:flagellar motor switch protein FliN